MSKEFDELKKAIKNEDETLDVQLDDTELEDSIKDDDDEEHEESHMEKFSAMVRQSLSEEHEAAAQYTKRAAKCEKHGMEDAAKLFRDIAAEEVVHAGEFQALMEKYDILDQESIEQGEQEAKEILDGEKTEPEIDAPEIPADDAENESVNEKFIKQVTQDEWNKTPDDYKMIKNGEKYMVYLDPERHATVLGKVKIVDKKVNEETTEYLEKGEIYSRLIQLLDLTTNEDTKAVALLSDIINFLDVDQAQSFYEFIQQETDMNYNEIFGSKKESAMEDAFSGLKEHFMQYLSDIDKTKAPGYYKNTFKLDKDHEDYKRVLVVEIAKSYLEGKDLQAPLQAQFNVEHEIEENFEKWLEEFQSGDFSNESRGRENPAVSIIKKGIGNMNYPAKSMKDAIAYVKQQNLDLENGDYFDIHTGMNTSEPDDLDFWGGTGAGYWRNVVNNPKTKDRVKQMVLDREVKSIQDLHESANEDYLNASPDQDYALKSLLPGEQHIPVKYYTERNIRNIYCSYLVQDMPDTSTMKDVDKINATYDEIRSKADNDPIDEILDFLNKTGDLEVHKRTENESINEGWNEDIYQYLVDYADQQGLNVADLAEYDPVEIADWISDRSGFPVDAEDVKDMIDADVQDTSSIAKENDEIQEDGTVASLGSAPTVVAGKGVIEAKPTKMCEELKALKEILEN